MSAAGSWTVEEGGSRITALFNHNNKSKIRRAVIVGSAKSGWRADVLCYTEQGRVNSLSSGIWKLDERRTSIPTLVEAKAWVLGCLPTEVIA